MSSDVVLARKLGLPDFECKVCFLYEDCVDKYGLDYKKRVQWCFYLEILVNGVVNERNGNYKFHLG